ncbi:hypothetical protein DL98DRAFT_307275 [Cadophora sp. DSE1049]|nr:hypothetical protein DL98DRAFT_307275 [Cadophora sp. DSE1049]
MTNRSGLISESRLSSEVIFRVTRPSYNLGISFVKSAESSNPQKSPNIEACMFVPLVGGKVPYLMYSHPMAPETPPLPIHKASARTPSSHHPKSHHTSSSPSILVAQPRRVKHRVAFPTTQQCRQVWWGKRSDSSEEILSAARLMPKYRRFWQLMLFFYVQVQAGVQ